MALTSKYPDPSSGWQPHQALITRLYKDEDLTLKEVKRIMETRYGFKATYAIASSSFV